MPGYRLRLPQEVHPISAGVKGGIVGGLVMPMPALLWGLLSGHGIWYPVNLLAGMVLPGVGRMTVAELEQFHAVAAAGGLVIHVVMSVVLGLILRRAAADAAGRPPAARLGRPADAAALDGGELRGDERRQSAAAQGGRLALVHRLAVRLRRRVPAVVLGAKRLPGRSPEWRAAWSAVRLMAVPAVLWAAGQRPRHLVSGRTCWPGWSCPAWASSGGRAGAVSTPDWLASRPAHPRRHVLGFGVALRPGDCPGSARSRAAGLGRPAPAAALDGDQLRPDGRRQPGAPGRVDWPWFIVSQFVFGVAAAIVVVRSEKVYIPPAGRGPDRVADFVAGEGGGRS